MFNLFNIFHKKALENKKNELWFAFIEADTKYFQAINSKAINSKQEIELRIHRDKCKQEYLQARNALNDFKNSNKRVNQKV